ncbi:MULTISPECIES: BMP family lipoprotein [Brevibacterium]|uniref:BMP family lipoprotein n=1 Tax=Brevibacterium TaxID=1696 RepID=UPI00228094A7|nr:MULTISPECIES: BMP family ABC transporter substrate-binding protein [Brevibacterium]WAL40193.1 BMP family ABC transporter substrate-binding protein [Brevibacterium sp. BRM-1]
MKRKQLAPLTAVVAVSALALSACGQAPSESKDSEQKSDYKACMVSDAGGWDDRSFNQSGKEGFDKAVKEFGLQESDAESKDDSDFTSNVDQMVQQGCKLIYGVGFNLAPVMTKSAQENKDIDYALIDSPFTDKDGKTVELDNAKPIEFNTAQAAFLAGYVAAGTTKSNKVATFGGMNIPSVTIFMDGFADGVKKFNQDKGKDVKLLGWDKDKQSGSFSGDFDNQSQGQTLANQFLSQGADIVMPVAGPVGLGAAAAVKKKDGAKLIWVDSDGYESAPDYKDIILTSVVKGIANSVYDTAKEAKDDKFSAEPYVGDLSNDGVGIAPYHDLEGDVPDDVKKSVDDLKQQIIDGKLKVESKASPK